MNNTKDSTVFGVVSFVAVIALAGVLASCQILAKRVPDEGAVTEVSAGVGKVSVDKEGAGKGSAGKEDAGGESAGREGAGKEEPHTREVPAEQVGRKPADDTRTEQKAEQRTVSTPEPEPEPTSEEQGQRQQDLDELRASLGIVEDYRAGFVHGDKPAEFQKYIVLHDTEGEGDGLSVVQYWDAAGNGVAAHFVVNKDGSIVQCVPLDKIAHHAGFGDVGHNARFGVEDESRDDKAGTSSMGSEYPDYGMNSWSVGIEMVHVNGSGTYPEEQLTAVDRLIAYIDAYFGFESQIIDHKAWRTVNSDTSAEFAGYLANYQAYRTHNGA